MKTYLLTDLILSIIVNATLMGRIFLNDLLYVSNQIFRQSIIHTTSLSLLENTPTFFVNGFSLVVLK